MVQLNVLTLLLSLSFTTVAYSIYMLLDIKTNMKQEFAELCL